MQIPSGVIKFNDMKLLQNTLLTSLLLGSISTFAYTPPGAKPKTEFSKIVSGIITDDYNKPLRDVSIKAVAETSKEHITATSATNGSYSLVLLKPGIYKLVFEKEGYKRVIKEKIKITDKEMPPVMIEMPLLAPYSERGPSLWHFFDS